VRYIVLLRYADLRRDMDGGYLRVDDDDKIKIETTRTPLKSTLRKTLERNNADDSSAKVEYDVEVKPEED